MAIIIEGKNEFSKVSRVLDDSEMQEALKFYEEIEPEFVEVRITNYPDVSTERYATLLTENIVKRFNE